MIEDRRWRRGGAKRNVRSTATYVEVDIKKMRLQKLEKRYARAHGAREMQNGKVQSAVMHSIVRTPRGARVLEYVRFSCACLMCLFHVCHVHGSTSIARAAHAHPQSAASWNEIRVSYGQPPLTHACQVRWCSLRSTLCGTYFHAHPSTYLPLPSSPSSLPLLCLHLPPPPPPLP